MTATAIMLIQARHGKVKIVSSALKKYSEVKECYEVFGRFDIFIRVEVESDEAMKSFMQNKLQITEGIKHIETLVVYDTVKKDEEEETSYSI
jgi:DNA-binding Lrp family transcriptional regulator